MLSKLVHLSLKYRVKALSRRINEVLRQLTSSMLTYKISFNLCTFYRPAISFNVHSFQSAVFILLQNKPFKIRKVNFFLVEFLNPC